MSAAQTETMKSVEVERNSHTMSFDIGINSDTLTAAKADDRQDHHNIVTANAKADAADESVYRSNLPSEENDNNGFPRLSSERNLEPQVLSSVDVNGVSNADPELVSNGANNGLPRLSRETNLQVQVIPGSWRVDGIGVNNWDDESSDIATNSVSDPPEPAFETAISAYVVDEEEERQRIKQREEELTQQYEDKIRLEMVSEMQHAEPVDPNEVHQQRDRMASRRHMTKFAAVAAAFVCTAVGVCIALVVVLVIKDEDESTPDREEKLMQLLKPISGSALHDKSSPRYNAFRWLVDQDPMQLNLDESVRTFIIVERYVVALFYFVTGGPSNWTRQFGFMSNTSVCNWRHPEDEVGVICHLSGRVRYFEFVANNLYGTLPDELSALEELEEIYIYRSKLYGTIPSSLKENKRFEHLMIAENEMTGTIPDLSSLRNFQRLTTAGNYLTGTFPSWVTMSGQLEFLNVGANFFSGTLPPFAAQDGLEIVVFSGNLFTGTIPESLASLSVIEYLDLSYNMLTGPIPSSIGRLTTLRVFLPDRNGITGVIPTQLGLLLNLAVLYLRHNKLTGTLPTELGQLSELSELLLNNNLLSGVVPTQLASLERLQGIDLHNNSFTGNTSAYCSITSEIGGKTPDFFSADCAETTEDPELVCPCCSHCCSDELGSCYETASLEERCANRAMELEASASDKGQGTVCECLEGGFEIACRDTNCMYCNENGSVCYVDSKHGVRLGVQDAAFFGVGIQYVKGRDEEISFMYSRRRQTGDVCTATINDNDCKSCILLACDGDGFLTFAVDCSNLGYGRLSSCYGGDDPFDAIWWMINGLYYDKDLPIRFDCVDRDAVDGVP